MSAKSTAQGAIDTALFTITELESGSSLTVDEIERLVGDARTALESAIEALRSAYGVSAEQVIAALQALAAKLQQLGQRLIDDGSALAEWTAPSEMPVPLIAHILYGDLARVDELVKLNAIPNPNRIKAGTVLKVVAP